MDFDLGAPEGGPAPRAGGQPVRRATPDAAAAPSGDLDPAAAAALIPALREELAAERSRLDAATGAGVEARLRLSALRIESSTLRTETGRTLSATKEALASAREAAAREWANEVIQPLLDGLDDAIADPAASDDAREGLSMAMDTALARIAQRFGVIPLGETPAAAAAEVPLPADAAAVTGESAAPATGPATAAPDSTAPDAPAADPDADLTVTADTDPVAAATELQARLADVRARRVEAESAAAPVIAEAGDLASAVAMMKRDAQLVVRDARAELADARTANAREWADKIVFPLLDNLDRAIADCDEHPALQARLAGVRQETLDVLGERFGISRFEPQAFDPESDIAGDLYDRALHDATASRMPGAEANRIIAVTQSGYLLTPAAGAPPIVLRQAKVVIAR